MTAVRNFNVKEMVAYTGRKVNRRSKSDGPYSVADIPHKEDQRDLKRSMLRLRDVKAMLDKLDEEKKKLTGEIGDILDASGVDTIRHLDIRVLRIRPEPRRTLKRELLLEHGIDPEVISKCEVETPVAPYVKLEVGKE